MRTEIDEVLKRQASIISMFSVCVVASAWVHFLRTSDRNSRRDDKVGRDVPEAWLWKLPSSVGCGDQERYHLLTGLAGFL